MFQVSVFIQSNRPKIAVSQKNPVDKNSHQLWRARAETAGEEALEDAAKRPEDQFQKEPKEENLGRARSARTTSARSDEVIEDPAETVALPRSCFASLRVSLIAHLETHLAGWAHRFDEEEPI
jgi:hypothetical protein